MLSVPDWPNAVMVTTTTATTISLSWTVPHGSFGIYEVMWKRDVQGRCTDEAVGSTTIIDSSTNYTITGLEEDSNYIIIVRVTNAMDNGSEVSDPITGMTEDAGEGLNDVMLIEIRCNYFLLQPHLPLPLLSVYLL